MAKQEQLKKDKWIDRGFFLIVLVFFSALMLYLFYRQCTGSEQSYHSDMMAYIKEMQGIDSGYSFPYPILFKLGAFYDLFTSPELAMALSTMTLNSLALVAVKWVMNRVSLEELQKAWGGKSALAGVVITLISLSLFFVSMVYPPGEIYLPGILRDYLGVFSGNPYYNATYMAARPFAVVAFFQFALLLDKYEAGYVGKEQVTEEQNVNKGVTLKEYLLFAISLLLSTMAKPSFTIVLVGAAGLIMLFRLFRSRFKNFVPTVQLGLCFLPTFADLLYQYSGVFVPDGGEEGGIGFTFGEVWGQYCQNIPLAIGLAVGFPILVFILNYRELKNNTLYRFSWQIYWMGFVMAFFLYEKGFRKGDFNFSWGYMYGIFFAFIGALLVLLQATATYFSARQKDMVQQVSLRNRPLLLIMQWLAYGWHLICGIYYFSLIYGGAMYYSVRW